MLNPVYRSGPSDSHGGIRNVARGLQGLPKLAVPVPPDPFTLERNWQATTGRGLLLRTRRYR